MQANRLPFLRATGLLACALLALPAIRAAASDQTPAATESDAFPVFENHIVFSGQNAWVSGDKSAYQAQNWNAGGASGGIEDFRYDKDMANDVSMQLNGHALAGSNDCLAHFNLSKNEVASIDTGYSSFRTFYDGVGGFFPANNAWMPLPDQDLSVNRSKFWTTVTVDLPDRPVFTLSYVNELRDGNKDSTSWGDSDLTGIPVYTNSASGISDIKLAPSYINLDERHQSLQGMVKQTVGNTTYQLSLVGDHVANLDTRYFTRYPGEVKLYPAPPTTPAKLLSPYNVNNQILGVNEQGIATDSLSATGKVETVVSENLSFHVGASFEHLTSSFTGNRTIDTSTPTKLGVVLADSANFQDLTGGASVTNYIANAGLDLKLGRDFSASLALRGEDSKTRGSDSYNAITASANTTTGVVTLTSKPTFANASVSDPSWTPELNLRYTGIRDITLYSSADYRYVSGNEHTADQYTTSPVTENEAVHENHGRYTIGADWAPCTCFSLRVETFCKDHQNNFQDYATSTSDQYVLGYQLYGGKITATVSPLAVLTCTTRLITQAGKMETCTTGFATYQSMQMRSNQIGETIDWNPLRQFYMEGSINVVYDRTSTDYPQAGGVADQTVQNANNNYWDASVLAGCALDKATNGEAQFTYYRANDYQPALTTADLLYGAGAKNYQITLGVKRKLSSSLIVSAKVGYLVSRNDQTGDMTDYTARVAYVSLDHAF